MSVAKRLRKSAFIIDSKGVVRAKVFLDGYRQRHTADDLIKAAASTDAKK